LIDDFGALRARNLNLARLVLLRNLAHEIHVQESVIDIGALDFDMVGELEVALESPARETAMEILRLLLFILLGLAGSRLYRFEARPTSSLPSILAFGSGSPLRRR
jgi:hypothetical protein